MGFHLFIRGRMWTQRSLLAHRARYCTCEGLEAVMWANTRPLSGVPKQPAPQSPLTSEGTPRNLRQFECANCFRAGHVKVWSDAICIRPRLSQRAQAPVSGASTQYTDAVPSVFTVAFGVGDLQNVEVRTALQINNPLFGRLSIDISNPTTPPPYTKLPFSCLETRLHNSRWK